MKKTTAESQQGQTILSIARARSGAAFAELVDAERAHVRLYCYRVLASMNDADVACERTVERANRKRRTYEPEHWPPGWSGREDLDTRGFGGEAVVDAPLRRWLYKIATEECAKHLDGVPRRKVPHSVVPAVDPRLTPLSPVQLHWFEPCPDTVVTAVTKSDSEVGTSRESVEYPFLVGLQTVPLHTRASLVLRDLELMIARHTAWTLDSTKASINSAMQRGRPYVQMYLPQRGRTWTTPRHEPEPLERETVQRFTTTLENADVSGIGNLLYWRARLGVAPRTAHNDTDAPIVHEGRESVLDVWSPMLRGNDPVELKTKVTGANLQPAVAVYARSGGRRGYRPYALFVLRIVGDEIVDIAAFTPELFPTFGLPASRR